MEEWEDLKTEDQIREIIDRSFDPAVTGIAVFKYSSRCSINGMAFSRLKRMWMFSHSELPFYFLDLLAYRSVSNKIAEVFNVKHESPQLLFIKNGKCLYHASHGDISANNLLDFLKSRQLMHS